MWLRKPRDPKCYVVFFVCWNLRTQRSFIFRLISRDIVNQKKISLGSCYQITTAEIPYRFFFHSGRLWVLLVLRLSFTFTHFPLSMKEEGKRWKSRPIKLRFIIASQVAACFLLRQPQTITIKNEILRSLVDKFKVQAKPKGDDYCSVVGATSSLTSYFGLFCWSYNDEVLPG